MDFLNHPKIQLRAHYSPNHMAFLVYAYALTNDGKRVLYSAQLTDPTTLENGAEAAPLMSLDKHAAQMLMDSLWNDGVRPTEHVNSIGQVSAMQSHIEDLRKMSDQTHKLLDRLVK